MWVKPINMVPVKEPNLRTNLLGYCSKLDSFVARSELYYIYKMQQLTYPLNVQFHIRKLACFNTEIFNA